MHHSMISDSEVEVITLGSLRSLFFFSPLRLFSCPCFPQYVPAAQRSYVSHRSGGWRQLISSHWHNMMDRLALDPLSYSRAYVVTCRRQTGSVSDAWRVYWSATAGQTRRRWSRSLLAVSSFLWVIRPRLPVTGSEIQTLSLCVWTVCDVWPLALNLRTDCTIYVKKSSKWMYFILYMYIFITHITSMIF